MREPETVLLVVHLFKFAAIQVLNTDIVWPKVLLGAELFPMALVWLVGLEFGIYQPSLYPILKLYTYKYVPSFVVSTIQNFRFSPQPILQYFYHQIYHINRNATECLGSVSR